jgi:hypothetical protein
MATPFAGDAGAVASTAADETVREVDALLQKLQVRMSPCHKQPPRCMAFKTEQLHGNQDPADVMSKQGLGTSLTAVALKLQQVVELLVGIGLSLLLTLCVSLLPAGCQDPRQHCASGG